MSSVVARMSCVLVAMIACIPALIAAPSSEEATVAERVQALRDLSASAQAGEIPPAQIPAIKELRQFLAQESPSSENTQIIPQSSLGLPIVLKGQAQRRDKFPLDCREIQRRFHLAKTYWNQMLCLADRIVALSARPCPDLHCIKMLRQQADLLKEKIDLTYPTDWDQRNVSFSRRWTFYAPDYFQQFDAFLGKPQILADHPDTKLQFTKLRSLKWRGVFWDDISAIPFTKIIIHDDYVDVAQQLSVTNYCLEPMRMEISLDGHLSGFEDHPFGVHLKF